jgi:hypothetical protein
MSGSVVIIGYALIYMALPSGHGFTATGRVFVLSPGLLLSRGRQWPRERL